MRRHIAAKQHEEKLAKAAEAAKAKRPTPPASPADAAPAPDGAGAQSSDTAAPADTATAADNMDTSGSDANPQTETSAGASDQATEPAAAAAAAGADAPAGEPSSAAAPAAGAPEAAPAESAASSAPASPASPAPQTPEEKREDALRIFSFSFRALTENLCKALSVGRRDGYGSEAPTRQAKEISGDLARLCTVYLRDFIDNSDMEAPLEGQSKEYIYLDSILSFNQGIHFFLFDERRKTCNTLVLRDFCKEKGLEALLTLFRNVTKKVPEEGRGRWGEEAPDAFVGGVRGRHRCARRCGGVVGSADGVEGCVCAWEGDGGERAGLRGLMRTMTAMHVRLGA